MDCFVNLEGKAREKKSIQSTTIGKKLRNLPLDLAQPTVVPGTDIALQNSQKYGSYRELLIDIRDTAVPKLIKVFKDVRLTGLDRRGTVEGLVSLGSNSSRLISKNQAFTFLQQALALRDAIQAELKALEMNELVLSARVAPSSPEP